MIKISKKKEFSEKTKKYRRTTVILLYLNKICIYILYIKSKPRGDRQNVKFDSVTRDITDNIRDWNHAVLVTVRKG